MAEKETAQSDARTPGPELRLVDRRAYVGFPTLTVGPGIVIQDFALQIPDVTFPLNISGGASKYQKKKLDFGFLELLVDADVIARQLPAVMKALGDLDDLKLHFKPGVVEAQARLRGPERTPLTFKVAFDGDGERLAVYLFDVRLYAFSTTPAARIAAMVSQAVEDAQVLPEVERRGANGFTARILPQLVERAAVGRGYKMPSLDQARLIEATVSTKGLRLRFSSGGLPPPGAPDEELMLALEGARAFADAEELVAHGKLREARDAYLRLGDASDAHPFAVERLLSLLVADPQAHELALDVAASLLRRRDKSATALWAEAVVRERRGEFPRASERYLALSNLSRKNQEDAGAFFAAEAAARASRDSAPHMAVKALHELLGLKPDHLPSLKALARASDQANDRAGSIRAYRRLAALARDPADAAEAHVQLARLCAQTEDDIAGARLHCEAALRLAPDHPDALYQLGELCFRSGEHLRAIKALDRLREVALGRHEVDRIGRANMLAGRVWETGLKQLENAALRYREAASLLPSEPEPLFLAARAAEGLGKVQEAVAGYQQAIELAGPAPRADDVRKVAHDAHHALAGLLKNKLGEPTQAREHLEAALGLDPTDTTALDELLPYFRASGKTAELADACEKAAVVINDGPRRAALWAEAGELYRSRLGQPEKAEKLLTQAIEADPKNRSALEGLLSLAEAKRDGAQLTRCLRALAELATDPKERARHYRRLAVAARDLSFDLDLAVHSYREVLRVEPDDLPILGELTALERRRQDMPGLAWALEQRARAAEVVGDKRLSAAALRELGQVLDARLGRGGEALVAFEKAARLSPDANALIELANLSLRLERAGNARRALEDALALLPKHAPPERLAEVRAKLGRACELLGDKEAAREAYALAFPVRRLDDELAANLERLYVETNATRELTDLWASRAQALMHAGRAQDAAPLFFKSARSLLSSGDAAAAMLRLSAALDASPTGEHAAQALEEMAHLEVGRGEVNEAARFFSRRAALEKNGRDAARFLFKSASLTRGSARELPYLEQALEKDGTFAPARLRRADLTEETNPRDALGDLEVVLAGDPGDADLIGTGVDLIVLQRRASFAALRAQQFDSARRLFSKYCAVRPGDLEAQLELAKLHRRAGAVEPLVDLLGELWPRLEGAPKTAARKEYAEGALSLGRTQAATDALRSMLADEPSDAWAAQRLLALLPPDDLHRTERLTLLSRMVESATGEARAELLSRRSELHRQAGDLPSARADLLDASTLSATPLPLLRGLAELARQSHDDAAELSAWNLVLERAGGDENLEADAVERLLAIAQSRVAVKDNARALEAFESVVRLKLSATGRFEAWYGLAKAAQAAGAPRRTEEALLEASRQGPAPRRVEALLERAALLEAREARLEAIAAFEQALALAPRHQAATQGLIRNLRTVGDFEGLAEVLSVEARQVPKAVAVELYRELAALYLTQLNHVGPGEAALRRVIALDAADAAARLQLSHLLSGQGRWQEAASLLEDAALLVSDTVGAGYLREAAALARANESAELELRLMRMAHVRAPATGTDLVRLADALYLQGALREALPLQKRLAEGASFEDEPDEAERVLLRLADLAQHAHEDELAERTLRRVVKERPLNVEAVERLAALVAPRDRRQALELVAAQAEQATPTPRTSARLLALSEQAAEIEDIELAYRLGKRAAATSDEPLPVRERLIGWLRAAGRTSDLMAELLEVGQLKLTRGDIDGTLAAYDEEARLAESSGRIDEALRTLTAIADVCDDEGRTTEAARAVVRQAELLRDSKLDLDGSAIALEKAWGLEQRPDVAEMAMALARRRNDRNAEIDWLERTFATLETAQDKAGGFIRLARLHLGLSADGGSVATAPLTAPDQAEAALREALKVVPRHDTAEGLLLAVYERQGRFADIAAYYEDVAARVTDVRERADLLLRAADLYRKAAGRPHDAAAALLAARAANPDDMALTARVADMLHELGRVQDAADFDALVLEAEPFHPSAARHRSFLETTEDWQGLAGLLSRQAERSSGEPGARLWLEAANAFRQAGAFERAHVCETQAFDASPSNREAFDQLLQQASGDARRQAELFVLRARAVPGEATTLLEQRAQALTKANEALLAAGAWDDYLALAPDDLGALEQRAALAAAAGGAKASQPYDRRLVQLGGESLSIPTRLTSWLRLGHAALDSQAWRDAVDALEVVHGLDATGPKGAEALSLLTEAYARAEDIDGQYRTTMRLAQKAEGQEREALLRRAVALQPEPQLAFDALDVLFQAHPADEELSSKLALAYRAMGRLGEVVAVYERHAQALGGSKAARALLTAADLAERELLETGRAFELRSEAARLDPNNNLAQRAVLEELRRRGDEPAQERVLASMVETADTDSVAPLRLEWAALLEKRGALTEALAAVAPLRSQGASMGGYSEALEVTLRIARAQNDLGTQATTLLAQAQLQPSTQRAQTLLEAAQVFEAHDDLVRADSAAREALATTATVEALALIARVAQKRSQPAQALEALQRLATLKPEGERVAVWLEAADLAERANLHDEAVDLVERLLGANGLTADDAATRMARLGEVTRALEIGFAPAVERQDFARALELADAAKDEPRTFLALWKLTEADPTGAAAQRLATTLETADDVVSLRRLAALQTKAGAVAGWQRWLWLATTKGDVDSMGVLLDAGRGLSLYEANQRAPRADVTERLLQSSLELTAEQRADLLLLAVEHVPTRRAVSLRELADVRRGQGQLGVAAETLAQLSSLEEDPKARAALHVERGELLRLAGDAPLARMAFERALVDDANQVPAVRALVDYFAEGDLTRFSAMAERLLALAGPDALTDTHRPLLAKAYEAQGRTREAYVLLGSLPETTELLQKRAALAEALGFTGEALAIKEKFAQTPAELEVILEGYLKAELVPFSVRLGATLLDNKQLSAKTLRLLAERLAPTTQGAVLACRAWPTLLSANVNDVDGWTLYSEALRNAGRDDDAALADGFGAALSGTVAQATPVKPGPLRPDAAGEGDITPGDAMPVTPATMPRLHSVLESAAEGFGVERLRFFIDPTGGVEGYLAAEGVVIIGAGALTVFTQLELPGLLAVALAMGRDGRALKRTGPIDGFDLASVIAFDAYPSSLAMARVVAQLDASVRGSDPLKVDVPSVLRESEAFQALALRAVERLAQ